MKSINPQPTFSLNYFPSVIVFVLLVDIFYARFDFSRLGISQIMKVLEKLESICQRDLGSLKNLDERIFQKDPQKTEHCVPCLVRLKALAPSIICEWKAFGSLISGRFSIETLEKFS